MAGEERVLLIGLDSADADLIERWCDSGDLPNLASLRTGGSWNRVGTTSDVLHVSAWPTLYTGARPGQHGMYHAYQIRGGEQEVHRTEARELGLDTFWKLLDEAGIDCLVLDAFMDHDLEDFRGVQVLEYGTWTWFDAPKARPAGLWKELTRRFGPYPAPEHTKVHGQPPPATFRDQLVAGARVKGEAGKWLLETHPWRVAFLNFAEPHPAGHYLWHVSDAAYPTYPGPGLDGAMLDVYRAVDEGIGRLLEAVDDSVTVIVLSGDGMGPNHSGCHLVPEVLHRLDMYHGADVGGPAPGTQEASSGKRPRRSAASYLRGLVPLGFRRAVSRCLPAPIQHRLSMKWANADIDWERTTAFCIPNANEAYVRINLEGREPRGNVAAGEAYAERVAFLQRRLGELVNPENGVIAAERVHHAEEVFPGPRRVDLPDVIVTWNEDAKVLDQLASEACGHVRGKTGYQTAPHYTGNHRPTAFTLARGPRVPVGERTERGHLVDLAPTLLAWMGVDIPPHMEGRPWDQWFGGPRSGGQG